MPNSAHEDAKIHQTILQISWNTKMHQTMFKIMPNWIEENSQGQLQLKLQVCSQKNQKEHQNQTSLNLQRLKSSILGSPTIAHNRRAKLSFKHIKFSDIIHGKSKKNLTQTRTEPLPSSYSIKQLQTIQTKMPKTMTTTNQPINQKLHNPVPKLVKTSQPRAKPTRIAPNGVKIHQVSPDSMIALETATNQPKQSNQGLSNLNSKLTCSDSVITQWDSVVI